ncbi:hypothetical protein [Phaeodactylibacter luteus]|uniref:Uncharacterized protein n=1 Tax=Phaeodactylibacter luteus TaxID=1564516 RepID=A0A5C6RT59_9BACT|nr:hypothetical protein [Phaeodactylibacter luteus]TXB65531.1 hypothetical protein FRY97_06000 [Phaeodactylibacter luteus]
MNQVSDPQNAFTLKSWFKEIRFYEQEIRNCEWSLEEVLLKAQSEEDRAKVEHFQNQFLLQRLNLQRLNKQLREALAYSAQVREHAFSEVRHFRKYFKTLLKEFDAFLHRYFAIPELKI